MVTDHRHGTSQTSVRDRAISNHVLDLALTGTSVQTLISPPGAGKKIVVTSIDGVDVAGTASSCGLGFSTSAPANAAALAALTSYSQLQLPANGGEVLTRELEGGVNEGFYAAGEAATDFAGSLCYSIVPA